MIVLEGHYTAKTCLCEGLCTRNAQKNRTKTAPDAISRNFLVKLSGMIYSSGQKSKVATPLPEGSVAGLCLAEWRGLGQSPNGKSKVATPLPEGSVAGLCLAEWRGLGQSPNGKGKVEMHMSDNTPCLYVVATPIGNLEDMTPRAVRILGEVDMIAAEDTRHSRVLLSYFNIKTPMFSCHKFNEEKRGGFFITALSEGKSIALISDAGTPCISDPGHRLVSMAAGAGFPVVAVCGASAVVAALSVSGFDVSRFSFVGFLPRTKGDMLKYISGVLPGTAVFYESPKRIEATLRVIAEAYPMAQVCLCNDISKKFERVYHGAVSEVLDELGGNENAKKGEYACVIHVPENAVIAEKNVDEPSLESQLVDIMVKTSCTLKDAGAELNKMHTDVSKKEIYAAMLNLKNLL